MSEMIRQEILPGIFLNYLRAERFANNVISIQFACPLQEDRVSSLAVLPHLLRRGNDRFPDLKGVEEALDRLYGARIEPYVRKKGDHQYAGFVCDTVDGGLAGSTDDLTGQLIALASALLTQPLTENGGFCPSYVEEEKVNLCERITARINDKRSYAVRRLNELICEGHPAAIDELGTLEGARALTPQGLYRTLLMLLTECPMELFYCGGAHFADISRHFTDAFSPLRRRPAPLAPCMPLLEAEERTVEERMDVTQGKLAMGFLTGITAADRDYPALMVANALFGAGTTSRLFLKVREELSLCYYASSSVNKVKGLLTVSSGIDPKDFKTAKEEILRQLSEVAASRFTEEELENARLTVRGALEGAEDSPVQLEDFALGQRSSGSEMSLQGLIRAVNAVSAKDAAAALSKATLKTVYFLRGKEENHD